MSDEIPSGRGRGRGNRGGLGKYLRARGRGRGMGRPAVFSTRLVLEGEQTLDPESEEAIERAREIRERYARRDLGTNADRYVEAQPDLDSDGEEILEPEVDLTAFLDKQLTTETPNALVSTSDNVDPDDIDYSLAHLNIGGSRLAENMKGKVKKMEWDDELEDMQKEKKVAEANWELKTRFRAKTERERYKVAQSGASQREKKPVHSKTLSEAPPLPSEVPIKPKAAKNDMEDFLDDLLA